MFSIFKSLFVFIFCCSYCKKGKLQLQNQISLEGSGVFHCETCGVFMGNRNNNIWKEWINKWVEEQEIQREKRRTWLPHFFIHTFITLSLLIIKESWVSGITLLFKLSVSRSNWNSPPGCKRRSRNRDGTSKRWDQNERRLYKLDLCHWWILSDSRIRAK